MPVKEISRSSASAAAAASMIHPISIPAKADTLSMRPVISQSVSHSRQAAVVRRTVRRTKTRAYSDEGPD
jgi:hypothetical protein